MTKGTLRDLIEQARDFSKHWDVADPSKVKRCRHDEKGYAVILPINFCLAVYYNPDSEGCGVGLIDEFKLAELSAGPHQSVANNDSNAAILTAILGLAIGQSSEKAILPDEEGLIEIGGVVLPTSIEGQLCSGEYLADVILEGKHDKAFVE